MKINKEDIELARNMNCVEVIQSLGYPLKHVTSREYKMIEHNSLRISPEKGWYWHSEGIGGNAIDFVMKFENLNFPEAVEKILSLNGDCRIREPEMKKQAALPPKTFNLPIANCDNKRVMAYLIQKRGIDKDIVFELIKNKSIYEEAKTHNAVFVGYDENTIPKYGFRRGTTDKRFAGDVEGSDKNYSFKVVGNNETIHVFEAAIDALSYATIKKIEGDVCRDTLISLSGGSALALKKYLETTTGIKTIYVRTDNDQTGRKIYEKIYSTYHEQYNVLPAFAKNKDYNEDLLAMIKFPKPIISEQTPQYEKSKERG